MKPDLSFYKVDRDSFLAVRPLTDRLSCKYLKYDYNPVEVFYDVANDYILRSFHSMFEFVSGEKTPSVVIDPLTTRSFCSLTENKIQLGTMIFADETFSQQMRVDSMYAVLLHEMWHKRYTVRDLARICMVTDGQWYGNPKSRNDVSHLLKDSVHVDILNVLEDYRIEKLGLREFPGYIFYFDQLRSLVIPFQAKKKFNVKHPVGIVIEYLMFLVLLPELLPWFMDTFDKVYRSVPSNTVPKSTVKAIIDKFDRYVQYNKHLVYSDRLEDILKATADLASLIPQDVKSKSLQTPMYDGIASDSYYEVSVTESDSKLEEYEEKIVFVMDRLAKTAAELSDNPPGFEQTAPSTRIERNQLIAASDPFFEDVFIYKPSANQTDPELVKEAKIISNHISRDLGFLASKLNQKNEYFELTEGDLDEDELYSISFSKNLFMDEEARPGFELDFAILLDISGSMNGSGKIRKAKVACIGMAIPSLESKHINMFVYGHSSSRNVNNGVELYEYINTKRGIRDWRTILTAQGGGGNADGYAIAKMGEIMLRDSQCQQKVLVVISDGMPAARRYGGEPAEQHVKQVVNFLESKGIQVIQICIDNIERSKYMFNEFIPYDGQGKFGKYLREVMQKKLQRFIENY